MEVMVGVSSLPAYVSGAKAEGKQKEGEGSNGGGGGGGGGGVLGLFSGGEGRGGCQIGGSGKMVGGSEMVEALSDSSSFGEASDDDDENGVVSSKGGNEGNGAVSGLGAMGSLEDSLPVKRGLSNCFSGRSKSFANLSDVTCVQDLQKEENPLNKRRRILMACKLSRRSSAFYSWQNLKSMPLVALKEELNQEENIPEEEEEETEAKAKGKAKAEEEEDEESEEIKLHERKPKGSCFTIADL